MTTANILVLPGDGIGPEVTGQAVLALKQVAGRFGHDFHFDEALMGGIAIDETGEPLPAETLRRALAQLKPGQREMVEKAYLGELSHSEIQAETGLPLGTIKSRIRLGLEKLRHDLKELRNT